MVLVHNVFFSSNAIWWFGDFANSFLFLAIFTVRALLLCRRLVFLVRYIPRSPRPPSGSRCPLPIGKFCARTASLFCLSILGDANAENNWSPLVSLCDWPFRPCGRGAAPFRSPFRYLPDLTVPCPCASDPTASLLDLPRSCSSASRNHHIRSGSILSGSIQVIIVCFISFYCRITKSRFVYSVV